MYPEEAILTRAVQDAIAFVEDSNANRAATLFKQSINAASEESGVELEGEEIRKLYTKVFYAAVSALIEWDFSTDFEHLPPK